MILWAIAMFGCIIFLLVEMIRPKSTQFTMKNPPKAPKIEITMEKMSSTRPKSINEKYMELVLERIELKAKLEAINFKIKEIENKF
jgi:hypothetical protein